jgi:Leucine-rich repeat (LRR) protein
LLLACVAAGGAIQLDCHYFFNEEFGSGYRTCQVVNLDFDSKSENIYFSGTQEQKEWVELVQIRQSESAFVPNQIFNSFPKIAILEMMNVTLKNIDQWSFKNAKTLKRFWARDNKIEIIPNNTFLEAPGLTNIGFQNNLIKVVEPLAFASLSDLIVLKLEYNLIESLPDEVFEPLVSLERLFMRDNQLKSLSTKLFEKNVLLSFLDLRNNDITYIEPAIFDKMPNLERIVLLANECIDFDFNKISDEDEKFKHALAKCESWKKL